jgi:hypothetical protein
MAGRSFFWSLFLLAGYRWIVAMFWPSMSGGECKKYIDAKIFFGCSIRFGRLHLLVYHRCFHGVHRWLACKRMARLWPWRGLAGQFI